MAETEKDKSSLSLIIHALIALLLLLLVVQNFRMPFTWSTPVQYHAVFLSNGQVLFGRLSNFPSDYPVLKDVYFVARHTDPNTGQARRALAPRSIELHRPDQVVLNAQHIISVEPVRPGSPADSLIAQFHERMRAKGGQQPGAIMLEPSQLGGAEGDKNDEN
ncbi:MAG: hypothetical protein ACPGUC_06955 [Gammaproteobacteria bacterium]